MAEPRLGAAKVDFALIGAQKSGTRALRHFLSQHPLIGLSYRGLPEVHFFDRDENFVGGPDYGAYHCRFSPRSLAKITGDVTPNYLYWKAALPRIRVYNADMKIIVLLRNPIDRAYSQWVMQFANGMEPDRFVAALLKEPFRRRFRGQHRNFSYLHRGFYSAQLVRLFSCFPKDQCLILKTDALRQDHEAAVRRVYEFLGVSYASVPEAKVVHGGSYAPMPPAVRRILAVLFAREIGRLEKLLGWDLSNWRK